MSAAMRAGKTPRPRSPYESTHSPTRDGRGVAQRPPPCGIGCVDHGDAPTVMQRRVEPGPGSGFAQALPRGLRSRIAAHAGVTLDDVRVHYGSARPNEVGALAYAQGAEIHLAPGQERHLPHEAWHLVQQRQGRVRPTGTIGGKAVNDDPRLEAEADRMGDRMRTAPESPGWSGVSSGGMRAATGAPVLQGKGWLSKVFGFLDFDDVGEAAAEGFGLGAAEAIAEMDPSPHPRFRNNQAAHYDQEKQAWDNKMQQSEGVTSPWLRPFQISYAQDTGAFKEMVRSGRKFLWTYDTSGELAIGSSEDPNKHALVAKGEDVYAAGTGYLAMSPEEENYVEYQTVLAVLSVSPEDAMLQEAAVEVSQRPMRPPGERASKVLLDFGSGHYHPRDAWRQTTIGWARAGFFVDKMPNSNWV